MHYVLHYKYPYANHQIMVSKQWATFILLLLYCFDRCISLHRIFTALEIYMDGLPHRRFPNVSLGIDPDESPSSLTGHHCNTTLSENGKREMKFTPNRRLQSETLADALHGALQLGGFYMHTALPIAFCSLNSKILVILAVGGHNGDHGNYNYGSEGSLNGLLAVWDSWLQYFFSVSSNTSSLVLLFDERDFNASNMKRINANETQRSRKEYLDHILINNMVCIP